MGSNFRFFNNQNYSLLRNESRYHSTLFLDDTFPAEQSSLCPTKKFEQFSSIEWKRPSELCDNPCLFISGSSVHDVCQGNLGNCWLVSSLAVLAMYPECLKKVIPNIADQEWHGSNPNKYTGIFCFCFWRYGEWIEVVIDDRLPCINNNLIFTHSKVKNEFWSALVEKAYAKISGSYECLIGGLTCESLVDFTGGIPEQIFDIKKYSQSTNELENLFKLLQFDWKDGSLICASIASHSAEIEEKLANGLITTHAYSVTGVFKLDIRHTALYDKYNCDFLLTLKIRNPWGQKEWNGALSDGSEEWQSIKQKDKIAMGWTVKDDGEFWIHLSDFLKTFNQITIVRLIKTGMFKYNSNWYGSNGRGCWTGVAGDRTSALSEIGEGGQFRIEIKKETGDIFLLHLLQKCKRGAEVALGVIIASVERNRTFMLHSEKFCNVKLEYRLGGSRSICLRYRLECGTYIIKPFLTIAPKYSKFPIYYLLRCFTTMKNNGVFLPKETLLGGSKYCICKSKTTCIISRLHIIQCELISTVEELDVKKVFCEICWENGEIFQTNLNRKAAGLIWDESFLLYRTRPQLPVIIKIVVRGRVLNTVIGLVICNLDPSQMNTTELIESTCQVSDPKENDLPCTQVRDLKLTWYHTDAIANL